MARYLLIVLLLAGLVVIGPTPSGAGVEKSVVKTLSVPGIPVDSAVSGDGSLFFVLTGQGKVYIYEKTGVLKDVLNIDGSPDMVTSSPDGNLLYLTDKESGAVQIVSVDFVQIIQTEGNAFKGTSGAPVVISIFSDFQCPYCAKVLPLLEQLLKQYPTEVKLVFKNFPLRMHTLARPAAIVAWAAGQQGKFWEMHDLLFANYNKLSDAKFKEFAQQIGLNIEQFNKDLLDPDAKALIQADLKNGLETGVRGIPTLFVNGRRVKNRSLAGFKQMIDSELGK